MESHIAEREHMMDLSRSGREILELNSFENRRLENESIVLEYLKIFKPVWLKHKFVELTDPHLETFSSHLYLKHVEKELRNIVEANFELSMFFMVQYKDSEIHVPVPQDLLESGSILKDISYEHFISAQRPKLIKDLIPNPTEKDLDDIE